MFNETEADAEALIEEYIEMYKSLEDNGNTAKQIGMLRQQIELAQKKKSKLLGYNATGQLSDRDFTTKPAAAGCKMQRKERRLSPKRKSWS